MSPLGKESKKDIYVAALRSGGRLCKRTFRGRRRYACRAGAYHERTKSQKGARKFGGCDNAAVTAQCLYVSFVRQR